MSFTKVKPPVKEFLTQPLIGIAFLGIWETLNFSNNLVITNLLCLCHGQQRMAVVTSHEGIEIISRHHGTYHVGSLSARDLIVELAGTVDGSAIIDFVRQQVANG